MATTSKQVLSSTGGTLGTFEEDFGGMDGMLFSGQEFIGLYDSDEEDLKVFVLQLKGAGRM